MKNRKAFTLVELMLCVAVIATLLAVLAPAYTMTGELSGQSGCISNLSRIGRAFRMYADDYDDTFPTNRNWQPGTNRTVLHTVIAEKVWLSRTAYIDPEIGLVRFEYGVSWVEGLYPYIDWAIAGSGVTGVWRCPVALDSTLPATGSTSPTSERGRAAVTYAMNCFMVENRPSRMKSVNDVMLLREFDRRTNAVLRPLPNTAYGAAPQCPFMDTGPDVRFPVASKPADNHLQYDRHGDGSNILFVDGHAKRFPVSKMLNSEVTNAVDPFGRWTNADGTIVITTVDRRG